MCCFLKGKKTLTISLESLLINLELYQRLYLNGVEEEETGLGQLNAIVQCDASLWLVSQVQWKSTSLYSQLFQNAWGSIMQYIEHKYHFLKPALF